MTHSPALDRIRSAALGLPETSEKLLHGRPTFFVADTPFAEFRDDHLSDGLTVLCVRTGGSDEQAMLIEANPDLYAMPADLGASGWVSLSLTRDVDWPLVDDRIARSWELAAPRRLLEAGGR